jgi:hypothetical protein
MDVGRLAPGFDPAATSPMEAAVSPKAVSMLKRHSALVRVIATGSADQRLFAGFRVQGKSRGFIPALSEFRIQDFSSGRSYRTILKLRLSILCLMNRKGGAT